MVTLIIILSILVVIVFIYSRGQKSERRRLETQVDEFKRKLENKGEQEKPLKDRETASNANIIQEKNPEHKESVVHTVSTPTNTASLSLPQTIELTDEMKAAEEAILHDPQHKIVWIYGAAGTGKSTFLNIIRKKVKRNFVVLAPTGTAARLIDGMTIHSFFHLPIKNIYLEPADGYDFLERRKYRSSLDLWDRIDLIIIDEISMVRADVLDEIDRRMRFAKDSNLPFGGTKMLFLGDPYQLPPVLKEPDKADFYELGYKNEYFFSSWVYEKLLATGKIKHIEFTKIFRQNDAQFLSVLNHCRLCHFSEQDLAYFNSRVGQQFDNQILQITTRKAQAENINQNEYDKLSGTEYIFDAIVTKMPDNSTQSETALEPSKELPAPATLKLKVGTHILLLVNANGYVNGTTAIIKTIQNDSIIAYDNEQEYRITRHTWENKIYTLSNGNITLKTVGSYTQFPIAYGWAMTIHKAQGKTVNAISVSFGNGAFAPGQAYVALSRVKTIDGLFLTTKVRAIDFKECKAVTEYFEHIKNRSVQNQD